MEYSLQGKITDIGTIQTPTGTASVTPKYQFLKIKSKYLIFEVLSYSGYREEICDLLCGAGKRLRSMLIQEHNLMITLTQPL